MKVAELLSYTPVELDFGTSGLRGLVTDMTDLECYINTCGFIEFLINEGLVQQGATVLVGGDLRESTPRIIKAVAQAITDKGMIPLFCGYIPTPALAYYGLEQQTACIMVTGSHIPADRNGIKFYKPDGEVLKADETAIKIAVSSERSAVYQQPIEQASFSAEGMLKTYSNPEFLDTIEKQALAVYVQRYTDVFADQPLTGKKVVMYQHSAVGRDVVVEILEALGAEVVPYGRSKTFVPIDSENVTDEDKQLFRKIVSENPGCFAIVSTDGDSDRPFVIDAEGTFYRGDILGCLVTEYLDLEYVATPISSNDAVDVFCEQQNIASSHTKIGSPYVIVAMQEAHDKYQRIGGWEVNGGFLLGANIDIEGKTLKALPTRDAVLPILLALLLAIKKDLPVAETFARLPRRYTGGGLVDDVPMDQISRFKERVVSGYFTPEAINRILVGEDTTIQSVDTTDGLRVYFDNGDVIHARPSGNAPQMRVYTNCDTQQRADDIVVQAIAADGFLNKLLVQN